MDASNRQQFEPLIGYDFGRNGLYDQKHAIADATALDAFMRQHVAPAFREGREAMLTDEGDNAVFHVRGGDVLFAGGGNCAEMASILQQLSVTDLDTPGGQDTERGSPSTMADMKRDIETLSTRVAGLDAETQDPAHHTDQGMGY